LGEAYCRTHAGVNPGRYILLAVSDTGIGMDESAIAQLFEPFSPAGQEGHGPGLGLAMISGFVKQCDGHVSVLSEPGQGSTFKIFLPEIEAGPVPDTQGPLAGWETILLAEDEDGVRSLTRQVLQSHGYTVLDAGRCEAALELAKNHPGSIHLLVSDIVMPGMSGQQLAGELAALHPGVRTLFISGYAEDTVLRYGVLAPGTAILKKPFTGDALPARVRQVLDQ
jgi:CheY-like chemotaxis protein